MEFNPLSTQNWSRAFNVWIEDIQIQFQPVMELERALIRGGLLRRVRSVTRVSAALVALFFTIHCTKAQVLPRISSPEPIPMGGFTPGEYSELGEASWYGGGEDGFEGKSTANGDIFDSNRFTCAHRTLPLGSYVEVQNLDSGKKATFRVNDRGPFARSRVLDVSRQGAKELGFLGEGVARVKLRAVNLDGSPALLDPFIDQENPFTVEVAALTEPNNLERLSRDLEDTFGPVTLQDGHAPGEGDVKRVRVGSNTRIEDAQKAAEEIVKHFGDRGVEPFIARRR